MKIKIFLSACAAVLLLMPALHASASHETAGQAPSKTSAHHADTRQMGEGTKSLPDDAMAIPTTAAQAQPTSKDQPATQPRNTRLTAPATMATLTSNGTDRSHPRHHRQRDDIPKRGSGFGIASLTLGLLAITSGWLLLPLGLLFAVLAVIFGGIGLGRNRGGRGMAIAGLTLGLVVLLITAMFFALLFAIFA